MQRKIVQLIPVHVEGRSGLTLYAVADDGTAWRTRHFNDGTFDDDGWQPVMTLPDRDKKDPLKGLGSINPSVV